MNAHFLHIRKTGGKSIMAALAPLAGAGAYTLRLHSHDWSLSDVPVGEKVFFTVRDPITRFVSGFYARFREGRLQFGDGVFKPHIARYYDRFPTARDLAGSRRLG